MKAEFQIITLGSTTMGQGWAVKKINLDHVESLEEGTHSHARITMISGAVHEVKMTVVEFDRIWSGCTAS